MVIDVVEFELGGSLYALDISLAREIVEMVQITPVPGAPRHIAGIINLRGEITNILDLRAFIGLSSEVAENQKIIVLVPGAAGNSNVGIIVDDVHSVVQISEEDVEPVDSVISGDAYVKGIIKLGEAGESGQDLVIWVDIQAILTELLGQKEE